VIYDHPAYIWQPTGEIPKFNIVPLIVGSLKVTILALLFSVPLSLGARLRLATLSPASARIHQARHRMLAGIPSVVMGFFALNVMAGALQAIFHYQSALNSLLAALLSAWQWSGGFFHCGRRLDQCAAKLRSSRPRLGSSRWHAAWQVVVRPHCPAFFAAVVLGFGRAVGETMIVLMASGNASIMSWNILDSARTITATIAAELGEAVMGSPHYRYCS